MDNDFNLAKIMSSDLFRQLRSMDLIDETELRNVQIRNDYYALRINHHVSSCIEILMQKYYLSDAALNNILFRKTNPA